MRSYQRRHHEVTCPCQKCCMCGHNINKRRHMINIIYILLILVLHFSVLPLLFVLECSRLPAKRPYVFMALKLCSSGDLLYSPTFVF